MEKNPPPPLAGGGWGEGYDAEFVRLYPSPRPLPQGEGEIFLHNLLRPDIERAST